MSLKELVGKAVIMYGNQMTLSRVARAQFLYSYDREEVRYLWVKKLHRILHVCMTLIHLIYGQYFGLDDDHDPRD